MRIVRYATNIISSVDLDGLADALILDADGNTSISAPTDDQIDVEIGGADDFTFTANSFNALTGSAVDLADSVQLRFGTGDDVTIAWDGTDLDILAAADNSTINFGATGNSFDIVINGSTSSFLITFDASANDLKFEDSVSLMFGTGAGAGVCNAGDVEIRWDATDLDILAAADDSVIKFGNGTNSFDIWFYGETASDTIVFDASAKLLTMDGVDVHLNDSDILEFGDAATGDVSMRWDATDFDILAAADDTVLKVGNGTNSFDVWVYGNTASDYILWDASAGKLSFVGAAYVDLGGTVGHVRWTPVTVAVNTSPVAADSGTVYIVNGGTGVTFTLPAVATSAGLYFKFINGVAQTMTVDGPANTLVVDNDVTATSIAFSTVGEKVGNGVEAYCDGNFWYLLALIANDDVTATIV